jgi:hypothetical protein
MSGGIVYFAGTRGGVGKTVMSHAACLGAILHDQPAVYVLTDPLRELREKGRPYGVLDGKDPKKLALILETTRKTPGLWTIIDGGGNRPAFDEEVADAVDLCIFPFRNTDEDIDVVGKDLMRIPKAIAWPTAWPTNPYALRAARLLLDRFVQAFPLRVINTPVAEVRSSAQLLAESLESPPTIVRRMARTIFEVMTEEFAHRVSETGQNQSRDSHLSAKAGDR